MSPLTASIRMLPNYHAILIPMSGRGLGTWAPQVRFRSGFSGVAIEGDGKGIHRSRTHRRKEMQRKSILGLARAHGGHFIMECRDSPVLPHHAILISPIHSLGIAVPTVSPPTQPGSWMMRY